MTNLRFAAALVMLAAPTSVLAQASVTVDPNAEVAAFERHDSENSWPKDAVLFAGSSSINLWGTADAFPGVRVIYGGFGGSTAEVLARYSRKLITKYNPAMVVLYTGENDLFLGKSAPQVIQTLDGLIGDIRRNLPCTPILYLSIKPSMSRLGQIEEQRRVNQAMQRRAEQTRNFTFVDMASPLLDASGKPDSRYFAADQLHLNAAGYQVWNKLLQPRLRPASKAGSARKC